MYDPLLSSILLRNTSLFEQDMRNHYQELQTHVAHSRILVIGAAGSIGSAFVKQIIRYEPKTLHLVDISENNLVELVRDLRSSVLSIPENFKTFAIGLGSVEFEAFMKIQKGYDYILNFAALKHVRAERDPYTLLRMFKTNVYDLDRFLLKLSVSNTKKFFSVSSDKSVNPVSIMGASKLLMERVMLMHSDQVQCATSRFANVAFSEGSLLYGFLRRIEKKQPLSAPADVKRYFISHEEAGQLCLLSCFLGENRDVYFPKLDETQDLITFVEIISRLLAAQGLKPKIFSTEEEAKTAATSWTLSKEWPCYFSKSDTSGEKLFEEFYRDEDLVELNKYQNVGVIHDKKLNKHEIKKLRTALNSFEKILKANSWKKRDIVDVIRMAIPEIQHEEKDKDLDQKM
ncbi:polysaccharide biosynthesis protein [Deltaproteobacteria bacterium TL4]